MPSNQIPFAVVQLLLSTFQEGQEAKASPDSRTGAAQVAATLVTATREEQAWLEAPYATSIVTSEDIGRRLARTSPQALAGLPGTSIQETGPGQGSPYLRGFTGYDTLLLIEGIRLNNSVFRSGPNQYFGTVDPLSIERIEVVRGPSSVLYGSDAMGGTVNVFTRGPYTYGEGFQHGESLYYRFGSADTSHTVRGEFSGTWGDSTGVLLGADRKVYDDVEAGGDAGDQPNTGYDEWAGDVKVEHFLDPKVRMVLGLQRLQQFDAPRTHRTVFAESFEGTTVGTDLRHDFDQSRSLSYLQVHGEDQGGAFDSFHASFSFHDQDETLKRVSGGGTASTQGFEVGTLGFFAYASATSGIGRLTYGADWYHDDVDSFSSTQPIQGPVADDATYDLIGTFLQDELELSERTTLTLGGRFNHAAVDADSVFDPVTASQTTLQDDWGAFAGSARFLHRIKVEALHLFGGISQGFRAPNLSDLTRLDSARSNEFEIPSPGLDPEYTLNYELGLKGQTRHSTNQLTVFYTDIDDLILRRPTGNVNGSGQFEVVKENVGDGYVYGIEAESAVRVGGDWEVFGGATFVEGKVDTFPTSAPVTDEEYLDKLMPFTARLGTRWAREDRWFELVATGAGDADKLSTADTLDTQRIPPGGTPGYLVLSARGGLKLGKHVALDVGLENLTDEDYRVHGSGLNRPGRSLVVGLTLAN
jgi:outer membrane receptor protein involved in Fe transport